MIKLKNILTEKYPISENLLYHINNGHTLAESIFRYSSQSWIDLVCEAREAVKNEILDLNEEDLEFIQTDIGKTGMYEGNQVYLDMPFIEEIIAEAEYKGSKVELNSPKRNSGSGKKYVVYVMNPKTQRVKKVTFGDVKGGLTGKFNDPKAKASFSARHNCPAKKDKLKAGYWACRANRYFGKGKGASGYW
jgi:hypothetical protein